MLLNSAPVFSGEYTGKKVMLVDIGSFHNMCIEMIINHKYKMKVNISSIKEFLAVKTSIN